MTVDCLQRGVEWLPFYRDSVYLKTQNKHFEKYYEKNILNLTWLFFHLG